MKTSTLFRGVSQWLNPVTLIFLFVLLLMAGAASAQGEFITTWKTDNPGTSDDNQITIPTSSINSPDFDVNWGDGNSDLNLIGGSITHTYASAGTYTVSISGKFSGLAFGNNGDKDKILTVEQWGDGVWETLSFYGCTNFNVTAIDAPNLSEERSLSSAFRNCPNFNADIGHWDVSTIEFMQSTFNGATSFNQDIGGWDVSKVSNMRETFSGATSFNQNLNEWDVSSATNMAWMFKNASSFNGSISDWEVSMVTNMQEMFGGASTFNQDISNWDITNVENMGSMFRNSSFDQDIGDWDVSGLTSFNDMFSGTPFNQDISSWDVSKATLFSKMFENATAFNQDISGWTFPNALSLGEMFSGATSFNQDLSAWDVSNIAAMFNLFDNSGLSKNNYDNILQAWSQQTLQNDLEFGVAGIEYCRGATARQFIIDNFNWTFVDGGENCIVNIPDANFKTALLADATINTVDDGEISIQEADAHTGLIDVRNLSITDLTGIEAFTKITTLLVERNNLGDLDLTSNTALEVLDCSDSQITSLNLDLSSSTALRILECSNNQLTSIDVTNLTGLEILRCDRNQLSTLDLSTNSAIRDLTAFRNQLSNLDLSGNLALQSLEIQNNQFQELDVSILPLLKTLTFTNNQISSIDVSENLQLTGLNANNNNLTEVDLTNHPFIKFFNVADNELLKVDLSNGTNSNILGFDASGNPNLTCISVDNPAYSRANWTSVDDPALFKLSCDPNDPVNIPDVNFKAALVANTEINTTSDGEITYGEADAFVGTIDVTDQSIVDFTGLEAFTNMTQFLAGANAATSIDVSNNVELTQLKVYNVPLAYIDLSNNTKLEVLSLGGNTTFSAIDLSNNTEITSLTLSSTDQVTAIEGIENLTNLRFAYISNNSLQSLDLSNALGLVQLRAPNNNLSFLDMRNGNNENLNVFQINGNSGLSCVRVDNPIYFEGVWPLVDDGVAFKRACDLNDIINIPDENFKAYLLENSAINTLDDGEIRAGEAEAFSGTILVNQADGKVADLTGIEYFSNLEGLQMISHEISEFDATNHPNLRNITLPGNNLSEIDIMANPNLTFVNLNDNDIASINVDNNVNIRDLKLNNNLLMQIDVTKLTLLTELTLGDNDLAEIDVTQNPDLVILDGYRNNLNSLDISQNTALKYLNLSGNNLTSIDITDQSDLLRLSADDNQLTSLDLSQNIKLEELSVSGNQLASLDLSSNTLLEVLLAQENSLSSLNVKNGSNTIITGFNITDNSTLGCVTVDDLAYAEANFTSIDDEANFSLDCSNVATDITTFSLTEQVAAAVIDAAAHTVLLEVPVETDLTSLTPTIVVSEGATIDPKTAVAQDFTLAVTYTITAQNPSVSQEWQVTVREENTPPSAIELDNNTITEGNAIGAIVGSLTSTDVDTEDTHTYSLVAGEGADGNSAFDISESNLIANAVFNFDDQTSYSIRIRSDDGEGGTHDEQFTISILDFTKSNQSITFPAITDKTYGDDRITLGATASSGLVVTYTITSGADFVSLSGNRLTIEGAGDVTIRANQAGNATFNPSASAQRSFTIDPAMLTITAESKQMVYGDELPALTVSYTGFVDDEDVTDLSTPPTITTTATVTSNVGEYPITVSGASSDDYDFTFVNGTHTIGKAPLTIAAVDANMVYGGEVPELKVTYDGFIGTDDATSLTTPFAAITTATTTSAVGQYPIAVADAVATNYELTYVAGSLSISEAVLTVTADDQPMIYGASLPVLTYEVTGFVNGDDATIVTAPTLTTAATSQSSVGTYPIIATNAVAPNYTVQYASGNLEIGKAVLLAKADPQSTTFGDDLPELTFVLSGFMNGDDASALEEQPTITSNLNRNSDAGTYIIEVSGGNDENYSFTYENAELIIAKATAQIILDDLDFTADGQPKLPTITTDPAGLEVDVAINEGKDAPTEPGVYNVVITIVDANYEGQVSGTLTINQLVSGIENQELPDVFPNPTRNVFNVGKEASRIERLVLFDLNGSNRKQVVGTNQLDVSDQSAGIYLLWVYETDGRSTYQKVIKRN